MFIDHRTQSKTQRAVSILTGINSEVASLLKEINASEAGDIELKQLFEQIHKDVQDAQKRSVTETIRLGILGGRGSGKSTLANALMGDDLLPESAIVFCTSLPTTIKYSQHTFLRIESDVEEYNFNERNVHSQIMKKILNEVCKESENPNNIKKVSKIVIGLPQGILDGKEIVDVPGFTKGNPLHQAFAEQYAKHYCDVCLVLINNAESVEIGSHQGLEALARVFEDRLESTIFIINKCDQSTNRDIEYVRGVLQTALRGMSPIVLEISAKNSLNGNGPQFQHSELLGHLAFLAARRTLVLVRALSGRLISNFTSLKELCNLSTTDLDVFHQNIQGLLSEGIDKHKKRLNQNLRRKEILPETMPRLDISEFELPQSALGFNPYEYASQLVDSIQSQISILDKFVQKNQAVIYKALDTRFELEITRFNQEIQDKVKEFEAKFGITSSIEPPKVTHNIRVLDFDPTKIEKLKPVSLRLWLEKVFPGILVRDVRFWKSPVSVKIGPFSLKLGIPIGIKQVTEEIYEFQEGIPRQAISVMNEYLYDALDKFVRELYRAYTDATNQFVKEWKTCLTDYSERISAAKHLTSEESQEKINSFINHLRNSHQEVSALISED